MDPGVSGIIGVILGVILGSWIGYYISGRLMQRQEFNKAAASFRIQFIKEQRFLAIGSFAYDKDRRAYNIVRDAINRHERAMIKFRPYLSHVKRTGFDMAWKKYCYNENKPNYPDPIMYAQGDGPTAELRNKELALERINFLLAFADPK